MNVRRALLILILVFGAAAHARSVTEILELAAAQRDPHDEEFGDAWLATLALADEARPVYTVNEARHGGAHPRASKLPANAYALYDESLPAQDGRGRVSWWAVEPDAENRCVYHRYQGANGEVHWNGATRRLGGSLAIRMGDVPRALRRLLSAYAGCRN